MKILKIYALKKNNWIMNVFNVQRFIVINFKVVIKEKKCANNAGCKIKQGMKIV